MQNSQRLKPLIEYKELQEKKAEEELSYCRKKQQEILAQLTQLNQYRLDYHKQCNAICGQGIAVPQLLEFRLFIDRLDKAIAGQNNLLRQIEDELQKKTRTWEKARQGAESLKKVHELNRKKELKHEDMLERIELDEIASNMHGMKNAETK